MKHHFRKITGLISALAIPILGLAGSSYLGGALRLDWAFLWGGICFWGMNTWFSHSLLPFHQWGTLLTVGCASLSVAFPFILENAWHGFLQSAFWLFCALMGIWAGKGHGLVTRSLGVVLMIGIIGSIWLQPNWANYVARPKDPTIQGMNFSIINAQGERLAGTQGKVVVFDTWSTTCRVCIAQFPEFDDLYRKYADDDRVVIFSLNLPDPNPDLAEFSYRASFTERFEVDFPFYFAPMEAWEALNIRSVPYLFIINAKGDLVYKGRLNTGWNEWLDHVDDLIEKAKAST